MRLFSTLSGDICDHSAFFILTQEGREETKQKKNKREREKRTTINTKMIYKYILWCLFSNPFKRTHVRTYALVHILKKQGGCLLIYYMPGMGMWLLRSVIAALETFLGGAWHILKGKTWDMFVIIFLINLSAGLRLLDVNSNTAVHLGWSSRI